MSIYNDNVVCQSAAKTELTHLMRTSLSLVARGKILTIFTFLVTHFSCVYYYKPILSWRKKKNLNFTKFFLTYFRGRRPTSGEILTWSRQSIIVFRQKLNFSLSKLFKRQALCFMSKRVNMAPVKLFDALVAKSSWTWACIDQAVSQYHAKHKYIKENFLASHIVIMEFVNRKNVVCRCNIQFSKCLKPKSWFTFVY